VVLKASSGVIQNPPSISRGFQTGHVLLDVNCGNICTLLVSPIAILLKSLSSRGKALNLRGNNKYDL